MKHLLKEGIIQELVSETGGGISGEVHLITHNKQKYILRKCNTLEKAKNYELISKKLENYNILPKFLGRYGKNVFFEFIEGRDLTKEENPKTFIQIGMIVAIISKLKTTNKQNNFYKQLNELVTAKFSDNFKVDVKRYRERLDKRRIKPLLSKEKAKKIKKLYLELYNKVKPEIRYDANDVTPDNFRIRQGKVYYIDIEGIKPRVKGFGIAKCFLKWAKDKEQQDTFRKGYEKIDKWFFEGDYANLCYMMFIIQALNYKCQIGRDYKADLKRLNKIIKNI
jgi:hypothetical protein